MADDALTGMRVLDLTQVMAGPYCTMVLADLGADVIKLEVPGVGDSTRRSWGRPAPGLDSPAFYALNRNKRSIEVDLRSPEGQEQFQALVAEVDVVVENFRPGVTQRLGVDYESVCEHLRLRPVRAVLSATRVRPHRPGHGRRHQHHR
jgi:crotonobetainyl-CoA:carnitine CoA-transferase CaiB-like acyl-CoA transferase